MKGINRRAISSEASRSARAPQFPPMKNQLLNIAFSAGIEFSRGIAGAEIDSLLTMGASLNEGGLSRLSESRMTSRACASERDWIVTEK